MFSVRVGRRGELAYSWVGPLRGGGRRGWAISSPNGGRLPIGQPTGEGVKRQSADDDQPFDDALVVRVDVLKVEPVLDGRQDPDADRRTPYRAVSAGERCPADDDDGDDVEDDGRLWVGWAELSCEALMMPPTPAVKPDNV